jgi:hypothetical protein
MNDFFSLRKALKEICFVDDKSFDPGDAIYAYCAKGEFPFVRLIIEDSQGAFYPFLLKIKSSPGAEDETIEGKLHKMGEGFRIEGIPTSQPLGILSVTDTAKILSQQLVELYAGNTDEVNSVKLDSQ